MDDIEKKEEDQEDLAQQWADMLQQENEEEKKEDQEDLAQQWADMLQQKDNEEVISKETVKTESKAGVNPEILKKLDVILDLPVNVTVEVGSKILSIEEMLKLTPNSVIDLDRYLNEPIDLKVNGVLIAKGELYQVEDNFAIKITEILTKEERVNLLSKQVGK